MGLSTWLSFEVRFLSTLEIFCYEICGKLLDMQRVVPSRRIRQGDSINPSLFLLYAKGLASLLFHTEHVGVLQGICNSRDGPPISLLISANDRIFLARSDARSVAALK
jgi:hypothetical protein